MVFGDAFSDVLSLSFQIHFLLLFILILLIILVILLSCLFLLFLLFDGGSDNFFHVHLLEERLLVDVPNHLSTNHRVQELHETDALAPLCFSVSHESQFNNLESA